MKRRFRGLRRRPPEEAYDVVVLGAGIGGLVCTNLLARAGAKVLLVEQHYMVGGYCSTFRRGGFTFDAATHFYPLLGNPETLTGRMLAELGVTTEWLAMDPVDTFHFPDGSRFVVPADHDLYRKRLARAFPQEADALDAFFAEVREAHLAGLLRFFRQRPTARFDALRELTVRQVIDRHFRDPKLKLLLTADSPHWGSPPSRTSFVFDAMLRLSYFQGNYYPKGGSQAFADELARVFEHWGGHILTSTRAEQILVADHRVQGVELETLRGPLRGRRRVEAPIVVSNADLLQTVESLLPPESVPPHYRSLVRGLRPTQPCFLTHLGLRGLRAEDLEPLQGYYWRSWDSESAGLGGLICKVFSPTLYEPAMAPEGGHVVILEKTLDMDPRTRHWNRQDWTVHKQRVEDELIAHFETLCPGISGHLAIRLSATARTSERFTLNRGGAMLGWEMSPDQVGDGRPDIRGPVPGLFLVGHWTRPGGGITPVMISARQVADQILTIPVAPSSSRWFAAIGTPPPSDAGART